MNKAKSKSALLFFFALIAGSATFLFVPKNSTSDFESQHQPQSPETWKHSPFDKTHAASTISTSRLVFVSLSDQVDRLIATHDPKDAYAAFLLIDGCITFQKFGFVPYFGFPHVREMTDDEIDQKEKLCRGLTERMRTSRLDYLTFAAKNKVDAADVSYFQAGPFGDNSALKTRPNDPLVLEWKKQAIEQLANRANDGDYSSLSVLEREYTESTGVAEKNPLLAFTYASAMRQINDHIGITSLYGDALLSELKNQLSIEESKTAVANANAIYANWLRHSRE